MRIKLNVLDGRFGLSGQVERVSVGVIDGAGFLEDLHGACELRGIIGARGKNRLDLVVVALIREGVYGDKRALALGDVGAEVLVGGFLSADKVEQVVLNLKGKARVQAKAARASICSSLPPPIMAPGGKRRGSAVKRGLVRRHVQVVINRDIKAPVTDPTQVERLTLDGADDHLG